ncbi:MAG: amidohydrolase family protein [Polyangiales bacterium]
MTSTTRILDSHVHQWDPRTTPREATMAVKLFGWSPRLLDFVVRVGMPKPLVDFVGRGEYALNAYLPADLREDWAEHAPRLLGVVHVQAGWKGKAHRDVVGETHWLETIDPEGTIIRAIVGAAHLEAPDLGDVLDAHTRASARFRGVRDMLASHPSDAIVDFAREPELLSNPAWRRGYAMLGERGLSYDAWMYHHQLDAFAEFAEATPDTPFVLCHLGTPVALAGEFAGHGTSAAERNRIEDQWRASIARFAEISHARFKISGLLMPILGHGAEYRPTPMTTAEFVDRVGPLATWAIDTIGIDRCMFGSNFPIDKVSIDYASVIAGFDQLLSTRDDQDKERFFESVARDFYRIEAP